MARSGFGASAILAPVIGGLLTDHYSWRSIFWFLLIYVAVTSPLLALVVPESPYRVRAKLDVVGAILLGVGLAGVLVYVSEGSSWGWGTISNLVYLGGLVLLAAFLLWESRVSEPLMELSMLRDPAVAIVMLISLFATLSLALPQVAISYMFETPTPARCGARYSRGSRPRNTSRCPSSSPSSASGATSTTRPASRCSSSPGTSHSSCRSPR